MLRTKEILLSLLLDKIDYINKMKTLLSDTDTYTTDTYTFKRNPISFLLDLKSLLKIWKRQECVTDHMYNFLNSTNAIVSRAYGLYFTYHCITNKKSLYNLAIFLHRILDTCLEKSMGHVKNNFQLANMSQVHLSDDSEFLFFLTLFLFCLMFHSI